MEILFISLVILVMFLIAYAETRRELRSNEKDEMLQHKKDEETLGHKKAA